MLRKASFGIAVASAIAMAPLSISQHGLALNNSAAANSSTTYFTLQPGATKTFMNGTEQRICHDDGPPLTINIEPGGTRSLSAGMCMHGMGHTLTLTNDSNAPVKLHSTTIQKTGH
jgi:hypothetical protein